jgi:hypothetical protein
MCGYCLWNIYRRQRRPGAPPQTPKFIALRTTGRECSRSGITKEEDAPARKHWNVSLPYSHRTRRSGRSSALPYPPDR